MGRFWTATGLESITQDDRSAQPVVVHDRPIPTSFPSLGRPVNHPEAEYAPHLRHMHFRATSCQIDLVLVFLRRALRISHSCIFYGLKYKCVSQSSYFYTTGQK